MKLLKGNIILIVLLTVLSLALWSCAGNLPVGKRVEILDANWGKSIETAKNSQIFNPDAGENLDPVIGLDGEPADYAVDKYKKSFEKVVPVKTTTTFNISQ